jgi:Golgi nucleoside diphosphatase
VRFTLTFQTDKNLKLKSELFEEVKPGLSAYADKPSDAAKSLEPLLLKAKAFIPKEEWSSTPISLKATAGLRLLPKEKADNILNAVGSCYEPRVAAR